LISSQYSNTFNHIGPKYGPELMMSVNSVISNEGIDLCFPYNFLQQVMLTGTNMIDDLYQDGLV
jgi:hypothetical protein